MVNKSWIYVLNSEAKGKLKLEYAPLGWEEQKVSVMRSPTYYGLFREVSTSLKFVKDGFDYIQDVYETQGIDSKIFIGIYEWSPITEKFTRYFVGLLDLSTYNIEETFIECDISDSDFNRKIMARDDVGINVSTLKSIGGIELTESLPIIVNLTPRKVALTGIYILDTLSPISYSEVTSLGENGFVCPITLDIDGMVEGQLVKNPLGQLNTQTSIFFNKPKAAIKSDIHISAKGVFKSNFNVVGDRTFSIRIYPNGVTNAYIDTIIFEIIGVNFINDYPFDFNVTIENLYSEVNGYELAFICYSNTLHADFECHFEGLDFEIKASENRDNTTAPGHYLHEAGNAITSSITDTKDSFYSDLLGRTDLGYQQDGKASFQTLHTGKQIRNIPNSKLNVSLKDFFTSLNAQYNIGIGIEYNEFDRPILRLEEKKHFFSGDVITTIHGVKNLSKSVARDWIYNEIEVGYAKSEYEEVDGIEEYNNKFKWTTIIETIKNKLDLVSKIRGDGYGIEFARRKQYNRFPTEDTKYDNEVFTITVFKDGNDIKNKKDEGFSLVDNIFSPDTAYNLDITPGRMLRNHGNVIRPGIEKYLDSNIEFHYAEQKQNLVSQKLGGDIIDENADVDPKTLNSPLWVAETYSFESVLRREQLAAIMRKSNGLIKFTTSSEDSAKGYYYGWIVEVDSTSDSNEATWKILRANLASSDLVLNDPKGQPNPGVPLPPPVNLGGFEYMFELTFDG